MNPTLKIKIGQEKSEKNVRFFISLCYKELDGFLYLWTETMILCIESPILWTETSILCIEIAILFIETIELINYELKN